MHGQRSVRSGRVRSHRLQHFDAWFGGLVRAAASELRKHGIRVNCVSPYFVATPLAILGISAMGINNASGIEALASSAANLKGVALKAKHVAEAALFLTSDESSIYRANTRRGEDDPEQATGGSTKVGKSFTSSRSCILFSLIDQQKKDSNLVKFKIPGKLGGRNPKPIPLPHRTILDPRGQDLDYVNVAHSHLVHSDWAKLDKLAPNLTPFRVRHILLKIQKDNVLSLEFFNWVETQNPNLHTLDTHSTILHILTKSSKFKSAESILKKILDSCSIHLPSKLFESILNSYRLCDSSPCVFDSLFKTYAHVRKLRNATDTFCQMKDYGFLPTVESCNAYLSALMNLNRADIVFAFYKEM
ncbi:hypothetical protein RHGRI_011401 [Rhododendron griersonianum]|uniref:Pentatricopeptide repeat-containing protein n=1 Tax=Rhododendron griersonianum TaxID=479676 RepID=A0AAV6KLL6_9ERIC|nr:hypothetical protein RHGRI_011401 [Rhododendron griersonianum]